MNRKKAIALLSTFLILLPFMSLCYADNYADLFENDLKKAKEFYQRKEFKKTVDLIEKHSEMLFYGEVSSALYSQVIEAATLLGNSYIRIGKLKNGLDVFQEINGATDHSDSYALYKTALFTFLFDETNSTTEILEDMRIYNLTPDYRLYTLLLSVLETNEGELIFEKIEASIKDKPGISTSGRVLLEYLFGHVNEDELLTKTNPNDFDVIKYLIGLKNEKVSGCIEAAKKYYMEVYNESTGLYKWLAAKKLGFYGVRINDYENYYDYGDCWTYIQSSSTLFVKNNPYNVKNLIDDNIKTAWVEGKANDGIGEWVEFTFEPKRTLKSIRVVNGYAKNETLYWANNRLKTVRITFDDGTYFDKELKDGILNSQRIILPRLKLVGKIRLTILDTYKGTKYNDTCISEVIFE